MYSSQSVAIKMTLSPLFDTMHWACQLVEKESNSLEVVSCRPITRACVQLSKVERAMAGDELLTFAPRTAA